jgi:hypothetical protein
MPPRGEKPLEQIKAQRLKEQAAANFATVVQKPISVLNRERQ